MAGIFNSAIFNNAIFNTGDVTPVIVSVPSGVGKRRKQFTARLTEIEKREDLADFLKKRLNLPLIEEPRVIATPKIVVKKSTLKVQETNDNERRRQILIMLGDIL